MIKRLLTMTTICDDDGRYGDGDGDGGGER
jgi:hypothetical protein